MKDALTTTFTGMAALGLAALLSAALMGGFSSQRQVPVAVVEIDVAALAEAQGVAVVRTDEMREIVDLGSHLILDARLQSDYDQGHIPTAMSVSVKDFEESFPMIAPMLDMNTPLVVYCTGPQCDDGLKLIVRMREAGFEGGVLYVDGMEGWE